MSLRFSTRLNRGMQQPQQQLPQPPARIQQGKRKRATNQNQLSDKETPKNVKRPNLRQKEDVDYEERDAKSLFHDQKVAFWEIFDKRNPKLLKPFERLVFEDFFTYLRENNRNDTELLKEAIRQIIKEKNDAASELQEKVFLRAIEKAWDALLDQIYAEVSPSTFAKSSGWVGPQLGPNAIDCLRPPDRSGLPIVLLDPAFAHFTAIIEQDPPQDDEYTSAARLASELCLTMSNHFPNKEERTKKFHSIVDGFFSPEFPSFISVRYGDAHPHASIVNRSGEAKLIIVHKNEPGSDGNAHMQGARLFDVAAKGRPIGQQEQTGCPAFIACIEGPQILICGGFRDGGHSVVEPLSTRCLMMPDMFGKRQSHLAKHLYALKVSMRLLFKPTPLPGTTIYCPRIYNKFKNLDGLSFSFTFKSPFDSLPDFPKYPLFLAKAKFMDISDDNEEEVLVKIVQGNYGTDAHRIVAESGFAPKLYGVASLDGAPSAYIMEHLSSEAGWRHPKANSIRLPTREHFEKLQAEVNRFLALLKEHDLVHGDLRPNNMFIRVQEDKVELRVVDWDWAGPQETARYPVDRNPAANLPGAPFGKIYADHDRITITKYFDQLKQ